ncbi:DMT family transporter [Catenulispora rubra]|uniref:DMT family transporter n=1 Tax=Catenulispora rubra TaxID=280293 RepID=UPI0018926899|nr:EamA family transporter [Catenulispora rubra]
MIYLVFSGVLWGTGGLTGRLLALHAHLSPTAVAGYRLSIGGTLLILFATAIGRGRPRQGGAVARTGRLPGAGAGRSGRVRGRAAWIRVGVIGALSAGFQACYFAAVALTDVSLATLLTIGAAPVLVVAFEQATGRRRLDVRVAATVSLAVAGLGLLVGEPPHGITTAHLALGALCAIASAAGFSAISLLGKDPVAGLDEITMTGYSFTLGGLVLLGAAAFTTGAGFTPKPAAIGLLAVFGLVPTAIAYGCYFIGLREAAASTGTVTALLEPLTGTVLAVALLGDRLTAVGILGAALLAVSVTAETWQARTRAAG